MKSRTKFNLLLVAACLLSLPAGVAKAAIVYTTDFATGYASGGSGAHVLGGATPDVVAQDWFGSTNNVGISGGTLNLNNTTANRTRGSAVWLDTSTWAIGTYTVEFDVTAFTASATGDIFFQAYSATGVNGTDSVSMDLHGSVGAGVGTVATGGAMIDTLGSQQLITAAGNDQTFTFNYTGAEQFVGLVFGHSTPSGGTGSTATLDNLSVSIPEPSTLSMLGLGALITLLFRRGARR